FVGRGRRTAGPFLPGAPHGVGDRARARVVRTVAQADHARAVARGHRGQIAFVVPDFADVPAVFVVADEPGLAFPVRVAGTPVHVAGGVLRHGPQPRLAPLPQLAQITLNVVLHGEVGVVPVDVVARAEKAEVDPFGADPRALGRPGLGDDRRPEASDRAGRPPLVRVQPSCVRAVWLWLVWLAVGTALHPRAHTVHLHAVPPLVFRNFGRIAKALDIGVFEGASAAIGSVSLCALPRSGTLYSCDNDSQSWRHQCRSTEKRLSREYKLQRRVCA